MLPMINMNIDVPYCSDIQMVTNLGEPKNLDTCDCILSRIPTTCRCLISLGCATIFVVFLLFSSIGSAIASDLPSFDELIGNQKSHQAQVAGRFIDNGDGTVTDSLTHLMWASKDSLTTYDGASQFCNNYRAGGYSDWRMPSEEELNGLYDKSATKKADGCHIAQMIHLSRCVLYLPGSPDKDTCFMDFTYFNGASCSSGRNGKGYVLPIRLYNEAHVRTEAPSHFVDNGDGTVTDLNSNLMWAGKDNGSDISWDNAERYCKEYRAGGFSDWRMPTAKELGSLYGHDWRQEVHCESNSYHIEPLGAQIKVTQFIDLSCWVVWSSETYGSKEARYVYFASNPNAYSDESSSKYEHFGRLEQRDMRALPVRSR